MLATSEKIAGVYTDQSNEDHALNKNELISAYKNYFDAKWKPIILDENPDNGEIQSGFEDSGFGKWSTSWSQQFIVLLKRDLKERKHEPFSVLRISKIVVIALLTGLLWYKSSVSHLQDQVIRFSIHEKGKMKISCVPKISDLVQLCRIWLIKY